MKVFISSPFAGDTVRNILWAQGCCRKAVAEGHFLLAPHLYFPQFLEDGDPDDRAKGMTMGLSWLSHCDEMWVFGTPSTGMKTEIAYAEKHEIPGEPKSELEKVVGTGDIDGAALSDLLDRAAAWAQAGLQIPSERFTNEMQSAVKEALTDFSGKRYVQSMDAGFCRFLDDFYHGRIS